MMQPSSYPLADEAAQRRHPMDKRVPRCVLLDIGIGLDPQAVTHQGDNPGATESADLSLEEVLE
jgi:hypothetical protein